MPLPRAGEFRESFLLCWDDADLDLSGTALGGFHTQALRNTVGEEAGGIFTMKSRKNTKGAEGGDRVWNRCGRSEFREGFARFYSGGRLRFGALSGL